MRKKHQQQIEKAIAAAQADGFLRESRNVLLNDALCERWRQACRQESRPCVTAFARHHGDDDEPGVETLTRGVWCWALRLFWHDAGLRHDELDAVSTFISSVFPHCSVRSNDVVLIVENVKKGEERECSRLLADATADRGRVT